MAEIHYLISDASNKVDVESHVLRYWEEELELDIPRNEMGHRLYSELHIQLFQKVKELKEKGYQLKAIKSVLSNMMESGIDGNEASEVLAEGAAAALQESAVSEQVVMQKDKGTAPVNITPEKMEHFQQIMNHIIGQALEVHQEKLSQEVGDHVSDRVVKEVEYLLRVTDEREEERFKQLDETIRAYQKEQKGRAEAAATKLPFFKRKRFGKSGKKLT